MKLLKFLIPLLLLVLLVVSIKPNRNNLEIQRVVLETQKETDNKQEESKKTQMLYFGATWCPPCNKMKQLFKDPEVKKELDRLDFRMYDESIDKPMFKKFRITKYPTTIFQAEGAITTRYTGYIPKSIFLEILRSVKD